MQEKILAVACIKDDGTILTMPQPARHHNIINEMRFRARPDQQGFITNLG